MVYLAVVLALMSVRQIATLATTRGFARIAEPTLSWQLSELPGLVVSVLIAVGVVLLGRFLADQRETRRDLRRVNNDLLHTQELAGIGAWEVSDADDPGWWSDQTYRLIMGERCDLVPAHPSVCTFVDSKNVARVRTVLREALESGAAGAFDTPMSRPDGERWWMHTRFEVVSVSANAPRLLRAVSRDVTETKAYEELLGSLATTAAITQEYERQRLAAALHDGAVQNLALCRIQLGQLSAGLGDGPPARLARNIAHLVDGAIEDCRDLLTELSPPVLQELGLVAAIEWLAEASAARSDIEFDILTDDYEVAPATTLELLIFQVARELIANVEKHSSATRATVELSGDAGKLRLWISDDGVGLALDPDEALSPMGGFGLFSVRQRVELLGGRIELTSGTQGTSIAISVDVNAARKILRAKSRREQSNRPQRTNSERAALAEPRRDLRPRLDRKQDRVA